MAGTDLYYYIANVILLYYIANAMRSPLGHALHSGLIGSPEAECIATMQRVSVPTMQFDL